VKIFRHLLLYFVLVSSVGPSWGAVRYANPGAISSDLTFSVVPATGQYSGTTVIAPMEQVGPAIGPVTNTSNFSLMFGDPTTAMRVDFVSFLSFVSIDFVPNDTDTGVLQAYSFDGLLLSEVVGRSNSSYTLTLNAASTPFAHILASYGDSGGIGRVGYDVAAIPEPNINAMMLAGLGLIIGVARRRKHQQMSA
jgi:hypothetical protein